LTKIRYAESPADVPQIRDVLSRSGLEFMQDMLAGEMPAPPIGRTLGFAAVSVKDGQAIFEGTPKFHVTNPMGAVHGGWYGTILDSCMACAVMTKTPKGSVYTTLEFKVNIIRPIPIGTLVRATGNAQHAGRSTGVASGEVRGVDDNRLYATGSTTCIIMKMESP